MPSQNIVVPDVFDQKFQRTNEASPRNHCDLGRHVVETLPQRQCVHPKRIVGGHSAYFSHGFSVGFLPTRRHVAPGGGLDWPWAPSPSRVASLGLQHGGKTNAEQTTKQLKRHCWVLVAGTPLHVLISLSSSFVAVFLCLSLSFSAFLCLSLSFSVFLCLSLSSPCLFLFSQGRFGAPRAGKIGVESIEQNHLYIFPKHSRQYVALDHSNHQCSVVVEFGGQYLSQRPPGPFERVAFVGANIVDDGGQVWDFGGVLAVVDGPGTAQGATESAQRQCLPRSFG